MLLKLFIYELVEADGYYDEVKEIPLLQFDIRDVFSVKNNTLYFECDDCKKQLKSIGTAIQNKQLYSVLMVNSKQIPVNSMQN